MPRALWSGSISFGLVNVPVRLYPAIAEHRLQFHYVHRSDDSPIGYQKICKLEEKPVPDDEIVKAFEFTKGEYVYLDEEDFTAAKADGQRTIDITDFVPYGDIDPIFFAKTYYVGPQPGAERVYSLLVEAMEDSELAGIAKFVLRDRQHIAALRIREGVIALEQLHYADEIRPVDELEEARTKVDKRELELAKQLIESFAGKWEPERYEDTYREELCAIIRAKRKGKKVHAAALLETEEEPPDLLAALRASVERSRSGKRAKRPTSRNGELGTLTKVELEERAKRAGISGRSKMSKDQLVAALSDAA